MLECRVATLDLERAGQAKEFGRDRKGNYNCGLNDYQTPLHEVLMRF